MHPGCTKRPQFNVEGQSSGKFCGAHKEPGMMNVMNKRCEHLGCTKQPKFNMEGNSSGKFCGAHKEVGMVNVKHRRCEHIGCTKRPHFNVEGNSSGKFCGAHKEPGMISVMNKRCEYPGCTKRPHFNVEGQSSGRFCSTHKEVGMVDVKNKRCQHPGCAVYPLFNVEGQARGIFCSMHKESNMVDVKSKRCEDPGGCPSRVRYGIPGHCATLCASHKTDGMIANPKRKCQECKSPAIYGMDASAPQFCEDHKSAEHLNLVQHECVICLNMEIVDAVGKCTVCSESLTARVRLRKQRLVRSWLDREPNLKHYTYDAEMRGPGCGRERPDFKWDTPTHSVILEVDEHQHQERPCECEQTRMVNISQALCRPCVWVRYNPDSYQGGSTRDRLRMDLLLRVLRECIKATPDGPQDTLRVCHLYFDGFHESDAMRWTCIEQI